MAARFESWTECQAGSQGLWSQLLGGLGQGTDSVGPSFLGTRDCMVSEVPLNLTFYSLDQE